MLPNWPALKAFALELGLPEVTLAHLWGNALLMAHGKMWGGWPRLLHDWRAAAPKRWLKE
jgi:hypothetical protein